MSINEHTSPAKLERYAFYWLLLLLLFSAAALFLGARPAITLVTGYYSSSVWSLLNVAWLISGAAAAYLTYLWLQNGKQVVGTSDTKTQVTFWFMLLAGYNLGITGLLGNNIFLNVINNKILWYATGVLCLLAAYRLYTQWKANDESLFGGGDVEPEPEQADEEPASPSPTPVEAAAASVEVGDLEISDSASEESTPVTDSESENRGHSGSH